MDKSIKIRTKNIFFSYQNNRVLNDISVEFREHTLTAIVGPSGIGKSTFLMTLNRLWESIPGAAMKGNVEIRFDGTFQDIYLPSYSLTSLRRSVGMVFQTPNPLPMSIYRNVAFPLKLAGFKKRTILTIRLKKRSQGHTSGMRSRIASVTMPLHCREGSSNASVLPVP